MATYRDLTHLTPDEAAAEYRRLGRRANEGPTERSERPITRVTLPFPPSSNRYWRSDRGGRPHLSTEARQYRREAALLAVAAGLTPLAGALILTVVFFRPRRVGDLSNRIKVLEDALNGVAWMDDSQIVELHAYRRDDRANPRVEVAIRRAPGSTTQEKLLP